MDFKIIHTHLRPWRVEFPRAILTFNPWVIHVFYIIRGRGFGTYADGKVGDGADGGVAHCAFEGVGRVGLLEAGEGVVKPLGGFGLGEGGQYWVWLGTWMGGQATVDVFMEGNGLID